MQQAIPFVLCQESEQIVKTYECTILNNSLVGKGMGYLTLTNKRVVYHAQTRRLAKSNITQKEMTLEDVAAISSSIGSSINWFRVMLLSLTAALLSSLYKSVMPDFFTHWLFGLALMVPYILLYLAERNVIGTGVKDILVGKGDQAIAAPMGLSINRTLIWIDLFLFGLLVLCVNVFIKNATIMVFLVFMMAYVYLFRPGQAFSLVIFSKTAKGPGILISGVQSVSVLGALSGQQAANDPVVGHPGADAELLIRELGALVSDLRLMGDHVVARWQNR